MQETSHYGKCLKEKPTPVENVQEYSRNLYELKECG